MFKFLRLNGSRNIPILYDTYITTSEYVCMVTKTWYLDGDWVKGREVGSWYRIDGWQFVPRYHYWNHVCLPHVNWPNSRDELSRGNLIWLRCEGWLPSAWSSSHYAMLSVLTDHITSPLLSSQQPVGILSWSLLHPTRVLLAMIHLAVDCTMLAY